MPLRKELALLDVLTLGKEQAINPGVDYDRCIRRLLLGVTLCITVATAMVGPISFLGAHHRQPVPAAAQTFRHTQLILGSALFGMVVLVGGQLIVEHVYSYSVPVSIPIRTRSIPFRGFLYLAESDFLRSILVVKGDQHFIIVKINRIDKGVYQHFPVALLGDIQLAETVEPEGH